MKWVAIFFMGTCIFSHLNAFEAPSRSQSAVGGSPGEWMSSFAGSVRSAGMGHVSTALRGTGVGVVNPAGISGDYVGEAEFTVAPLFFGSKYQSFSLMHPVKNKDSLGVTVIQLQSGDSEETDQLGQSIGSFNEENMAWLMSYSRPIKNWGEGGLNLKMVRQSVAGGSDLGYGGDVGYQTPPLFDFLRLGFSIQNLIPVKLTLSQKTDQFPMTLRTGLVIKKRIFKRDFLWGSDVFKYGNSPGGAPVRWGTGVEMGINSNSDLPLYIRGGVNQREYSAGLGIIRGPMGLDYALILHELEVLHQFGIKLQYGRFGTNFERKYGADFQKLEEAENKLKRLKREIEQEKEIAARLPEIEILRKKANDFYQQGHLKEAEEYIFKILKLDSKDQAAQDLLKRVKNQKKVDEWGDRLKRAKNFYAEGEYQMVMDILKDYRETDPFGIEIVPMINMAQAHLMVKSEDFIGAREELIKVVSANPDHEEAAQLYKRVKNLLDILSGGE